MNIIFDVDDTLYDQIQPFQIAYNDLWKDKYPVADVILLYRNSRQYSDDIFNEVLSGKLSIDESGIYRIKKAMADFNYFISEEEAHRFQLLYRHNQSNINISDTMVELLDYCVAQKITIGVLTNGVSEHQQAKIDSLRLLRWFDKEHIFISGVIGYSKPDVKAFEYIENKLKLNKEDTYYVGDSIDNDIVGSNNAKWKMIFLNRRNHNLSNYNYSVDQEVRSEEELLDVIKGLITSL